MIPLALVTGFLGSGKTTFLRQVSQQHRTRRLAYLVNDFAAVDLDAQALADLEGDVLSLPGGSIFCRCLTTSFIRTLGQMAAIDPPVEGVVIEASGMANPMSIADLLAETRLNQRFALCSVIALADPGTFPKLLATLPAIRAQIQSADLVLLNKTDLFPEAAVRHTEAMIRDLREDVPTLRCRRAEVAVSLFQGTSHALRVHAAPTACRDPSFQSVTVSLDPTSAYGVERILARLHEADAFLWRAKGFVPGPQGLMAIQWTLGSPPVVRPHPSSRHAVTALALIARGDASSEALDRLVTDLRHSDS